MKRKVIKKLIDWSNQIFLEDSNTTSTSKLIALTGVSGVGKTYLAYDFAKSFFESIIYINPKLQYHHQKLLEGSVCDIIKRIKEFTHLQNIPASDSFLLIIDDIILSKSTLDQLNQIEFQNAFPHTIIISSQPIPFDYSSYFYDIIEITPLEFDEFLLAIGKDWYIESIITHFQSNQPLPEIVHRELLNLFELYMQIGGMPSCINEYLNMNSTINVSEQHNILMGRYQALIHQRFQESDALKMNQVLSSLPKQLLKENRKFQYRLIRKGTTHGMYKDSIQNLSNHHYILQTLKCTTDKIVDYHSLLSYTSDDIYPGNTYYRSNQALQSWMSNLQNSCTNFKLYASDIGFLYTKFLEENELPFHSLAKKSILENYVAQALHSKHFPLLFWESNSIAKVDFIIPMEKDLVPIEIHVGENTRSKSMSILKQSYDFPYGIKISERNFHYSNHIKYIPYYSVFCI